MLDAASSDEKILGVSYVFLLKEFNSTFKTLKHSFCGTEIYRFRRVRYCSPHFYNYAVSNLSNLINRIRFSAENLSSEHDTGISIEKPQTHTEIILTRESFRFETF